MKIRGDSCVVVGDQSVPLEIRRRKGMRHLRLSLGHQNQVIVSVPWPCSDGEALKFVEKQGAWLEAQLSKLPLPCSLLDWLGEHPRLSASGDIFTVRIDRMEKRTRADYVFDLGGSELVLRIPVQTEAVESAILHLVRRFAKDALTCRVAYHAKRLGLTFSKLSVRDQSSRWGSCSGSGGISLNWRLVLLEPVLQDYIILHELAHLTEMNHSRRFWALLDSYDPARESNEAQLDRLTPKIMRVGR